MATPGQLVQQIAEILMIPPETVTVFDRALRDAGMLTKGGRGPSAPHRTPLDAARLLLSLVVMRSPSRGANAAGDFGAMVCVDRQAPKGSRGKTLESVCGIPSSHTLEEAIAGILRHAASPEFRAGIHDENITPVTLDVGVNTMNAQLRYGHRQYRYEHPLAVAASRGGAPKNDVDAHAWLAIDDALQRLRAPYASRIRTLRTLDNAAFTAIAAAIADAPNRAPDA